MQIVINNLSPSIFTQKRTRFIPVLKSKIAGEEIINTNTAIIINIKNCYNNEYKC